MVVLTSPPPSNPLLSTSYVPVGLLEHVPMGINDRPNPYRGRNDLETLMASPFDRVRASPLCHLCAMSEPLAHTHHTIHGAPLVRVHIHIKHQQKTGLDQDLGDAPGPRPRRLPVPAQAQGQLLQQHRTRGHGRQQRVNGPLTICDESWMDHDLIRDGVFIDARE